MMNFPDKNLTYEPKRLKDFLLEYAVMHFADMFLQGQDCVKENIILPCGLFESVIDKSKDMYWFIPFVDLKCCLNDRVALRWENIDLAFRRNHEDVLDENDLKSLSIIPSPIRTLKFYAEILEGESWENISRIRGLEILEIKHLASSTCMHQRRKFELKQITFQNIKRLSINYYTVDTDISSDPHLANPDSLEELEIAGMDSPKSFPLIQSLGLYKNLRRLIIRNCDLRYPFYTDIFQDLNNLKYLKTLDLSNCEMSDDFAHVIKNIINEATSIENLDLSDTILAKNYNVWLKRKVKSLRLYHRVLGKRQMGDLFEDVAESVAGDFNIKTYMAYLEAYIDKPERVRMRRFKELVEICSSDITFDMWGRLQTMLLQFYDRVIRYDDDEAKNLRRIIQIMQSRQVLDRTFLIKYCISFVSFFQHAREYTRDLYICHMPISSDDLIYSTMLDYIKEGRNIYIVKAFLTAMFHWLKDWRFLYSKIGDFLNRLEAKGIFEEIQEKDNLDFEAKDIIKNILHILPK